MLKDMADSWHEMNSLRQFPKTLGVDALRSRVEMDPRAYNWYKTEETVAPGQAHGDGGKDV